MEKRKEILSKLLISEEETLGELQELVAMATSFIRIEEKSGEVFFTSPKELTNKDKVAFLLIGKYFSNQLEISSDNSCATGVLSKKLNIPSTTLSKPLGQLVDEGIIRRTEDGKYTIVYYKVKAFLQSKSGRHG